MAATREPRRLGNDVRIPLALLLGVLGIVAGTVIWLTVASDEGHRKTTVPDQGVAMRISRDGEPVHAKQSPPKPKVPAGSGLSPPKPHPPEANRAAGPIAHPMPPKADLGAHGKAQVNPAGIPKVATETMPPIVEERVVERPGVAPSKSLQLPRIRGGPSLRAAPDPGLVQRSTLGMLPVIGSDGRKPWQVYARPFDQMDKRPRIAIVITALGLSSAATNTAIQALPGAVTLAFAPYADRLGEWIRLARAAGHEVLINVPMEPVDYPNYDPGPQTLLTSLTPEENRQRLIWTLSRVTGYVGVVDFMGSRFTMSRKHLLPVLDALNRRGLIFLDSRTAPRSQVGPIAREVGLPWAENSRLIDELASREKIDERLKQLEGLAKKKHFAIGMGSPYPVTLERLAAWIPGLKKRGIALAPITAMISRPVSR